MGIWVLPSLYLSLHLDTLDEAHKICILFQPITIFKCTWQSTETIISYPRGIKIHKNNYPHYDLDELIINSNIISRCTLPLEI